MRDPELGFPRVVLLITDGRSQDELVDGVELLKNRGVIVYAVGVGEAIEMEMLQMASYPPSEHMYSAFEEWCPIAIWSWVVCLKV